jgi:hypothetical protein
MGPVRFSCLFVVVALAASCKEKDPAAGADPSPSTHTEEPSAPAKPASELDESSFRLALKSKGPHVAGAAASLEVVLEAKPPYKCNDQYPYKFKVSETPGVSFPVKVVKNDALALEKSRAVMTVAFTPESPGEKRIGGEFAFSVCTAERCLVERRDLVLAVAVE